MRSQVFCALALVFALSAGCGEREAEQKQVPAATQAQGEPVPQGRLPRDVVPNHYRIALNIFPEAERFSGRTSIDVTLTKERAALHFHGRDLNVTRAEIVTPDGTVISAKYRQVDPSGVAELRFAHAIQPGKATLVLDYDAPFNTSLAGLYKVNVQGESYAFSQMEAIHARRVFPSFDEPGFKTRFDIVVTAHTDHEIVSTTMPEREEALPGGNKRVTFKTTPSLPTYLLAFAVGPLDIVQGPEIPANATRSKAVPLRGVTVHGKGDQMAYALEQTPEILAIMERYFGRAYPYDKLDLIAAPDFAAGAMENVGAIVYRETLILMNESAPLEQRRNFAYVHAHELAHQWFGNLVSPAWWEDIWLNEAFATWLGHRATAEWFPDGEYGRDTLQDGLAVMELDSLGSARRIAEPVNDANGIANAFDGITYSKGAAVLAMIENYVGADKFRDGVRLFMRRFADKNAATKDFLQALADSAKKPEIVAAFSSFLDRPGVPVVAARNVCTGGTVNLVQSAYSAIGAPKKDQAWRIPVCVRSVGGGAKTCTVLDKKSMEVALGRNCDGAFMPNSGGNGYYRFDLDEAGWRALAADFANLDASEQLVLIANADAAFRSGAISASVLLDIVRVGVQSGAWDSIQAITEILERLDETLIPPEARSRFQGFLRGLLKARWDGVGLTPKSTETASDTLLRKSLGWFMARTARDPSVRASLAKGGAAYVLSRGNDAAGLSPDLLSVALWVYVAEGGPNAASEALAALKSSNNAEYRQSLTYALSAARDEKTLNEIHGTVLSEDLRVNESSMLLSYLLGHPERRAGAWGWVKENIASLEKRFTTTRMTGILRALGGACEQGMRDDIAGFFTPRSEGYDGAPRQLALTLESVDRCIAFKTAKGAELAQAIAGVRR